MLWLHSQITISLRHPTVGMHGAAQKNSPATDELSAWQVRSLFAGNIAVSNGAAAARAHGPDERVYA